MKLEKKISHPYECTQCWNYEQVADFEKWVAAVTVYNQLDLLG